MKIIKILKFLTINAFLIYLSILFYGNFIWVGIAFYPGDAMEATNLSFVIMFIVILNTVDFVSEILGSKNNE